MQNGCLAPPSLASPAMSECSSSGNPLISSKSLNNNKDDLNDDKMDTTNENQSTSNRSSPVSMVEQKRENAIENLAEDDDDDDDDIVPIPSTVTSSTTSSLIASTAITTASNALTNTSAASKLSSITTASDVNDTEGKSSDDISAKDKEVSSKQFSLQNIHWNFYEWTNGGFCSVWFQREFEMEFLFTFPFSCAPKNQWKKYTRTKPVLV